MLLVQRARALGSQYWDGLLGVVIALVLAVGLVGTAQAQNAKLNSDEPVSYEPDYTEWSDCGLRKGNVDAFVSHRLPALEQKGRRENTKQATINVSYSPDFPQEAIDAYERAVEIWEAHIESDVEIRIDAGRIDDPEDGVLGGTIPNEFWVIETDGGDRFIAGDALSDALVGSDICEQSDNCPSGSPDMLTDFNFDRDDWHFGESDAPSGTLDFTSVALHEIGHGLHYLSLCNYENGQCKFELSDGSREAGVYTDFLHEKQEDGSLTVLTDDSQYPTSESLRDALTSDSLVFTGTTSDQAADLGSGPVPPKIYAPSSFNAGSSISHLDEATYPFEGPNALLTPRINTAETNRLPGPIVCGQLSDMGWSLGGECLRYFEQITDLRFAEETDPSSGTVTLAWTERSDAGIQSYRIEQKYFDGEFEEVEATIQREGDSLKATVDSVGLGKFAFRIGWTNNDGSEQTSGQELNTTINVGGPTANVSKDESGRGTVDLSWSVPPGTDNSPRSFTYRVERVAGTGDDFRSLGTTSQRQFAAERQTPGQYQYRIVSEDGQGNTLVSNQTSVEISFEGAVFIAGPTPNPVQDQASVELTAKDAQDVSIGVYNTVGERVYFEERNLQLETPTRLVFDSNRWASGMYFLHLTGEEFTKTRKMVVVH